MILELLLLLFIFYFDFPSDFPSVFFSLFYFIVSYFYFYYFLLFLFLLFSGRSPTKLPAVFHILGLWAFPLSFVLSLYLAVGVVVLPVRLGRSSSAKSRGATRSHQGLPGDPAILLLSLSSASGCST